ncbi:YciI family protein [Prochlorococcus sp. MIT 1223]|uniref:YciI family protein n=1 Tax=Prochlorococcus sp. MIT 1223 TaxID=3096217 RepID=UPI002A756752|nr:YciI family protein [Prochlorococcus sp. MIT 1223]
MERFVLWGKYCENAIEKRTPFREEHLDRLSNLKKQGLLITLGPTKCTRYVFGIFQVSNLDELRKIIQDDVYWREGIWISYDIYPWTQAF